MSEIQQPQANLPLTGMTQIYIAPIYPQPSQTYTGGQQPLYQQPWQPQYKKEQFQQYQTYLGLGQQAYVGFGQQ